MSNVWIVVAVVGAVTVLFKAAGPVFLGRRALPARVQSVVELLAPVMLTALVVTQTVGGALEDPDALGLDAAFAALFLALAAPYLRERRALQAAVLAVGIVLALTPVAPAGVPIVAAATACLLGLRR